MIHQWLHPYIWAWHQFVHYFLLAWFWQHAIGRILITLQSFVGLMVAAAWLADFNNDKKNNRSLKKDDGFWKKYFYDKPYIASTLLIITFQFWYLYILYLIGYGIIYFLKGLFKELFCHSID